MDSGLDHRPEADLRLTDLARQLGRQVESLLSGLAAQKCRAEETEVVLERLGLALEDLSRRIEAVTVAKVGLESIVSAFQTRYGRQAEGLEDVGRFRRILEEKAGQLEHLDRDLAGRRLELKVLEEELDRRLGQIQGFLAELAGTLAVIQEIKSAQARKVSQDRAKLRGLVRRFWPGEPETGESSARIDLPPETLSALVDQALNGQAGQDQGLRREILGDLVKAVADPDLKALLTQKLSTQP